MKYWTSYNHFELALASGLLSVGQSQADPRPGPMNYEYPIS